MGGVAKSAASAQEPLNFLLLGDWGKAESSSDKSESFTGRKGAQPKAVTSDIHNKKLVSGKEATAVPHSADTKSKNADDDVSEFGSMGGGDVSYQSAVAKAMATYAENTNPAPYFVVALGDNFYTNGVASTTDSLWDSLWTNIYLTNYQSLRLPWFPILGNHDYGYGSTGVQAQLDRTLVDEYWTFPTTNYTRRFSIPSGGSVQIVFIDTTTLAPSENKCCNSKG
jgi:hypothetical protein